MMGRGSVPDMDTILQSYGIDMNAIGKLQEQNIAGNVPRSPNFMGEMLEEWMLNSGSPLSVALDQARNDTYGTTAETSASLPDDPQNRSTASWLLQENSPYKSQIQRRNLAHSPTSSSGEGKDAQSTPSTSGHAKLKQDHKAVNRSHLTQRRYRERQKAKTAELINQAQQLKEQNKQLLDERADLQGRNNMLLQLLQQRDTEVVQLREAVSSRPASNPTPAVDGKDVADEQDDLSEALDTLTLTVAEKPIRLGPDQVRKMSQEELTKLWRDYVSKLALLLMAAEHQPGQQHLVDRIDQLTGEALLLLTRVAYPNPLIVKLMVATKLEDDSCLYSRDESHEAWLRTAATLGLTQAQKEAVRDHRQQYVHDLQDLLRRRHEVMRQYLDAQPSTLSTRLTAANYVKANSILLTLRQSMEEENIMVCAFIDTLYDKIFSTLQRARYIVQAYPWTPDHLAFTTAVAASVGDADADVCLSQLTKSSRSSPAGLDYLEAPGR